MANPGLGGWILLDFGELVTRFFWVFCLICPKTKCSVFVSLFCWGVVLFFVGKKECVGEKSLPSLNQSKLLVPYHRN